MSAFGGKWTLEKLSILESYLDAYTTALKDEPFKLWYIDAFAGSGSIELPTHDESDDDLRQFIDGSTQRAIKISNKQFDQLVFVEKDEQQCNQLADLKKKHWNRNIEIVNGDANAYLAKLDDDWKGRRGVLFLDPFSIQVRWDTLEKIESFRALDTWILFPVGTIARILPKSRKPGEIKKQWVSCLNADYMETMAGSPFIRNHHSKTCLAILYSRENLALTGFVKFTKRNYKIYLAIDLCLSLVP